MTLRALLCTDGSEASRVTTQAAARLADALGLEILLVHALNLRKLEYKMIAELQVEMIRQGAKRAGEDLLKKEADFLRALEVNVEPRLLVGDPGPAICDLASKEGVSMVLLGRRGQGDLQDILFGSVSNHVVHHSTVPVLVVKREGVCPGEQAGGQPVRALVGVDGSRAGERCLDFLASIAGGSRRLQVTLMHVVNPDRPGLEHLPPQDRYDALQTMHNEGASLLGAAAQRLAGLGFTVATRVEEGSAGRTLCRVCREDAFNMVILGRRGVGELADLLFGSVCHHVLHHCPGHTLVIP